MLSKSLTPATRWCECHHFCGFFQSAWVLSTFPKTCHCGWQWRMDWGVTLLPDGGACRCFEGYRHCLMVEGMPIHYPQSSIVSNSTCRTIPQCIQHLHDCSWHPLMPGVFCPLQGPFLCKKANSWWLMGLFGCETLWATESHEVCMADEDYQCCSLELKANWQSGSGWVPGVETTR